MSVGNYLLVLTDERKDLLKRAKNLPDFGRTPVSQIIDVALREFLEKHEKSQNPQTTISLFRDNYINAVPNLYAKEEDFTKFYKILKKREDYKRIDEQLNMILRIHNKKDREIGW